MLNDANVPESGAASKVFDRSILAAVAGIAVAVLLGSLVRYEGQGFAIFFAIARFFLTWQDLPVAVAMIAFLLLIRRFPLGSAVGWRVTPSTLGVLFAFALLFAWGARVLLLSDYDLSRDEQMVRFDAGIFAHGRLFQPIEEGLRGSCRALNTLFILPIGDREAWVSAYLPVNAALRAALGAILPASIISPLLVMSSAILLWRISRRLWPDECGTQLVVLLCFIGSSQVLLIGSTAYAMTPHLAFNLLWLLLFLRRTWAGHAAAIAVGFLATGLHQPVFHPLFVLPFMDALRREKRWHELAVYGIAYCAIGLFWIAWPSWVSSLGTQPVPLGLNAAGIGYLERLQRAIAAPTIGSVWLMGANLLRFVTWQHMLLLPLLIVGARMSWRDPIARALALGILLLIVTMGLILPAQAHGWGYRYLHGLIGNACLLAGFGWAWLAGNGAAPKRAMIAGTALSVGVALPIHAAMARSLTEPYAALSRSLNRIDADMVVVEDLAVPFGGDLVINRADLTNRPLLLMGSQLDPQGLARLCRNRRVAFADGPALNALNALFDQRLRRSASPRQQQLQSAAADSGCTVVPAVLSSSSSRN